MKLINISYTQYYNLDEKRYYNDAFRLGIFEPLDLFEIGNFVDQSFGFVKDWQEILNYEGLSFEKLINEMSLFVSKSKKEIASNSIFDLHRCIIYFVTQIEKINEIESKTLGHTPSNEEVQAGIDIFNKYHSFLQFNSLSGGDLLKFDQIRKLPYSVCLTKLMLDSDSSQFQTNLFKIRNPKN